MRDFVAKGGKWIYSDMFELYLDYPHSMIPLKKIYEFKPHLYKYAIPKCEKGAHDTSDVPSGFLGFEACTWTEHIDNEKALCEHIFPRVYALAERVNGKSCTDYESFKERIREKVKLLDKAGISYTKEEWWDPKGLPRLKDAVSLYLNMGKGVDEEEAKKQAASAAPKLPFVLHFIKEFFLKGN
jgi:N-acetyl-beta-hexosaminidase